MGKKNRENSVVLHTLVVDKFDFTRKILKFFFLKIFSLSLILREKLEIFWWEKIRENAYRSFLDFFVMIGHFT